MKVRNTIIIISDDSELSLPDSSDFSDNVVFSRERLPPSVMAEIDAIIAKHRTATNKFIRVGFG